VSSSPGAAAAAAGGLLKGGEDEVELVGSKPSPGQARLERLAWRHSAASRQAGRVDARASSPPARVHTENEDGVIEIIDDSEEG
jgi:hypothetical protein